MCPDYCFPNKLEEVLMLQDAMKLNPEGAKAPYYLGNFYYAARVYDEAIACWEKSASIDDTYPTVLRNLSLAYYNKQKNPQKALAVLEKAYILDESDARILMELDQLYKNFVILIVSVLISLMHMRRLLNNVMIYVSNVLHFIISLANTGQHTILLMLVNFIHGKVEKVRSQVSMFSAGLN